MSKYQGNTLKNKKGYTKNRGNKQKRSKFSYLTLNLRNEGQVQYNALEGVVTSVVVAKYEDNTHINKNVTCMINVKVFERQQQRARERRSDYGNNSIFLFQKKVELIK